MKNEKDIAKSIRREALKKNWRLFRRSKLGMIGIYIVQGMMVKLNFGKLKMVNM